MARDFSKNGSNYMTLGVNAVGPLLNGAAKISVHAWVYADTFDTGTNENRILTIINNTGSVSGVVLCVTDSAGSKLLRAGARSVSTDGFQARNATTVITTGAWHSVGAVYDIAGDVITPYYEGVAEGGGAVTFGNATYTQGSPGVADTDGIGKGGSDTIAVTTIQWDGRIAELAIWTDDVGVSNFAALAKGFSPLLVRPDVITDFWPLIGNYSPETDIISGKNGTIAGTIAKADHPRIIYPSRPQIRFPGAAAAGADTYAGRGFGRGILRGVFR